jgi:hypothetical protein
MGIFFFFPFGRELVAKALSKCNLTDSAPRSGGWLFVSWGTTVKPEK